MQLFYSGILFLQVLPSGCNIYQVNDQITPSVIQIQCVSVFCGPVSHTYFTYIYAKPQPLTPCNINSFYK